VRPLRLPHTSRNLVAGGPRRPILPLLALLAVLSGATVFSQQEPDSSAGQSDPVDETQQASGPMVVERVESGLVITPEVKFTQIDSDTVALVGGYGGWVFDQRLLFGFGGYTHADPRDDQKFGYGGLVVEWFTPKRNRVSFSVRTLVGAGTATLAGENVFGREGRLFDDFFRGFDFDRRGRAPFPFDFDGDDDFFRFRQQQVFFVIEPQANVYFAVSSRVRLGLGAGYRVVAADRDFDARLRGAVGTIQVQIALFD